MEDEKWRSTRRRAAAVFLLPLSTAILCLSLFAPASVAASPAQATVPDQAVAATAATIRIVPDYRAGTVSIEASFPPGAVEVRVYADGTPTHAEALDPDDTSASSPSTRLSAKTVFSARGVGAQGEELWAATATADPASFRPSKPAILIASRKVVGRSVNVRATDLRPVTSVRARGDDSLRWVSVALDTPGTRFTVSGLRVVRGPSVIEVVPYNGFGPGPKARRLVYWIGSVPSTMRSCVADKAYMGLFHVYGGRVVKWWPVAFGKSGTPTPNGDFKVGAPRPASGAWGVLRRRLYNVRTGTATSYYIHGTNAPWSIGTFASHGCIRMYNSHVREFARTVPNGTRVRIH